MAIISTHHQPTGSVARITDELVRNSGFPIEVTRENRELIIVSRIKYDGDTYTIWVTIDKNGKLTKEYVYFPDGELFLQHVIYICGGVEGSSENNMPMRKYIELPEHVMLLNSSPRNMSSYNFISSSPSTLQCLQSKWDSDCFRVMELDDRKGGGKKYFQVKGKKMFTYTLYYQRSGRGEEPYNHKDTRVYLMMNDDPRMPHKTICYLKYNSTCDDRYYMEFVNDIISLAGGKFNLRVVKELPLKKLEKRSKLPAYLPPDIGSMDEDEIDDLLESKDVIASIKRRKDISDSIVNVRERILYLLEFNMSEVVVDSGVKNILFQSEEDAISILEISIEERKKVIKKNDELIGKLRNIIANISKF